MKIGLYFGSFNPVHKGHTQLAQFLVDNSILDEVWFVVSPRNPLKSPEYLIDEYLRLDMVILAIKNISGIKACDIEFSMPVPSFTVDTLKVLKSDFPDRDFYLLIGSDNALRFHEWRDFEVILNSIPIMVYPREGCDFELVANKYPQMQLLHTPLINISSTQIREMLHNSDEAAVFLHQAVSDYITENSLYKSL